MSTTSLQTIWTKSKPIGRISLTQSCESARILASNQNTISSNTIILGGRPAATWVWSWWPRTRWKVVRAATRLRQAPKLRRTNSTATIIAVCVAGKNLLKLIGLTPSRKHVLRAPSRAVNRHHSRILFATQMIRSTSVLSLTSGLQASTREKICKATISTSVWRLARISW